MLSSVKVLNVKILESLPVHWAMTSKGAEGECHVGELNYHDNDHFNIQNQKDITTILHDSVFQRRVIQSSEA